MLKFGEIQMFIAKCFGNLKGSLWIATLLSFGSKQFY